MRTPMKELVIHMTPDRSKKPCDCDPLSLCASSDCVHTIIRTWDELVRLLDEAPHMLADVRIHEAEEVR